MLELGIDLYLIRFRFGVAEFLLVPVKRIGGR